MRDNFRLFTVSDPFARLWNVEFRWLQNAISIRHADTVDVKYYLSTEGEPARELVIALPHGDLRALAAACGRDLTDAWCLRLAGLHLEHMIATWEDMDKTIVTLARRDLGRRNAELEQAAAEARELAGRLH
jgi:hypothetical protein